jgi:acyl-CoA thioesterase I
MESSETDTGEVDVYVDGMLKLTLNGYNTTGWNNPVMQHILSEPAAGKHRIEIRMTENSRDKKFTILGFGYCD